jgi:hypothetical protein
MPIRHFNGKVRSMYVATIVRDKKSRQLFVRLGKSTQEGGNVELVDTLNGNDLKELKDRAERLITELSQKEKEA